MAIKFEVGDIIWHGWRYWTTEPKAGEVAGWNTRYLPYHIVKLTAARIVIESSVTPVLVTNETPKPPRLFLKREVMERMGKQYHTRFHEYFYAKLPKPESKDWNWAGSSNTYSLPSFAQVFGTGCLRTLGLSLPVTKQDVRRAYKRLAKSAHPDRGGNNKDFIKLKEAHDTALRFATA